MTIDKVAVTFILKDHSEQQISAQAGLSILEVAHANDVDLEGACEGSLACCTCHVIVDKEYYSKLEAPSEAEEDMLDLAFGLEETSRLGCQLILTPELDGIKVKLPSNSRNIDVDNLKSKL